MPDEELVQKLLKLMNLLKLMGICAPAWTELKKRARNNYQGFTNFANYMDVTLDEGQDAVLEALQDPRLDAGTFEPTNADNQAQQQTNYFDRYLEIQRAKFGDQDTAVLKNSIEEIARNTTVTDNINRWASSGLIVGRVQSGKTATYIGLITKLFDTKGLNLVVILTSNKTNLGDQTLDRLCREFGNIKNLSLNNTYLSKSDNACSQVQERFI